jgi:hypothetical protein
MGVLVMGSGTAQAGILLNELLADPARDWNVDGVTSSRDDEWVEIINTGPDWVNLAGLRLAGPDSVWRYEFSGVLAPGQVQVVYGRQSYDWEVANGFPAFGLRLSNSGGELLLFRVGLGGAVQLDCYGWADHEAEDDRSSGRAPEGGSDWLLFDGYNPYTGTVEPLGSGCFPTPGTHLSCPTPVEPITWGLLKAGARR